MQNYANTFKFPIQKNMNTLQDIVDSNILKTDRKSLNVEKTIFLLWEHRNNKNAVKSVAEILSYFLDEKDVFAELEFFLPQLAHLIIHLEEDSYDSPLQKLTILIARTSMHAALQLNFMFIAAMEDYQPETCDGKANGCSNPILFKRCAKLLQDIDRAVIYGNDASISSQPSISPSELIHTGTEKMKGLLLYKRNIRKSNFHSKPWKSRYFVIEQKVLLCFRDTESSNPLRAILLTGCRLVVCETHPKYGDCCFELISDAINTRYLLRADSSEQRKVWIDAILTEIDGAPPLEMQQNSVSERADTFSTKSIQLEEMSSVQRKRFIYFRQLKMFVVNMTNICERLRFKDRSVRKFFLKHDMTELVIPPFAYLPLCTSCDPFKVILRSVPKESHAFSTKARVPALMIFELETHEIYDVGTFLGSELEKCSEIDLFVPKMELVKDYKHPSEIEETNETDKLEGESNDSKFSKLPRGSIPSKWSVEGTGRKKLELKGIQFGTFDSEVSTSLDSIRCAIEPIEDKPGVLGETFEEKSRRLREVSPNGYLPHWNLGGLIAKSNDDVRQEVFIMQLIAYFKKAFVEDKLPLWLHTYKILSTSKSTGLIELIPNAISIDGLKKKEHFPGSLRAWYESSFGYKDGGTVDENSLFEIAMESYVSSMAAYGVVTYLLAIKDRHNGNIMIDKDGHIVHIDFGFVFGLAPGKAFSMEKAPWKLNKEMVSVMGGRSSKWFDQYRIRCCQALISARKRSAEVISFMEIMQYRSNYPAFRYNPNAIKDFRSRLYLDASDSSIPGIVDKLIGWSYKHSGSDLYDSFQLATNGIAK